jgi:hypothetical protein
VHSCGSTAINGLQAAAVARGRVAGGREGINQPSELGTEAIGAWTRAVLYIKVKFTGLAQTLGQLQASDGDSQSKFWANLKILGQPCESQVTVVPHRRLQIDSLHKEQREWGGAGQQRRPSSRQIGRQK